MLPLHKSFLRFCDACWAHAAFISEKNEYNWVVREHSELETRAVYNRLFTSSSRLLLPSIAYNLRGRTRGRGPSSLNVENSRPPLFAHTCSAGFSAADAGAFDWHALLVYSHGGCAHLCLCKVSKTSGASLRQHYGLLWAKGILSCNACEEQANAVPTVALEVLRIVVCVFPPIPATAFVDSWCQGINRPSMDIARAMAFFTLFTVRNTRMMR